jgi:two-component system sensor histidine kinase KdpD
VCIDSGSGISDEFEPQLFGRFTREQSIPNSPGTGLGLSISRGFVEAGGCTLDYERRHDRTTFVIRIPAAGRRA